MRRKIADPIWCNPYDPNAQVLLTRTQFIYALRL